MATVCCSHGPGGQYPTGGLCNRLAPKQVSAWVEALKDTLKSRWRQLYLQGSWAPQGGGESAPWRCSHIVGVEPGAVEDFCATIEILELNPGCEVALDSRGSSFAFFFPPCRCLLLFSTDG